ncbi:MAG: hypothetical protein HeimC3_31970 [Candidatus Heimdallarchaeota archaeon LC_3]|nr:MAG: hypothetical protein HeimC3_31970 [Candidatus Heimdallarchaeota archaeon LC_3]
MATKNDLKFFSLIGIILSTLSFLSAIYSTTQIQTHKYIRDIDSIGFAWYDLNTFALALVLTIIGVSLLLVSSIFYIKSGNEEY